MKLHIKSKLLLCATACLLSLMMTACSAGNESRLRENQAFRQSPDQSPSFTKSGSFMIARSVPEFTNVSELSDQINVLGFIPVEFNNFWLELNLPEKAISLRQGNSVLSSTTMSESMQARLSTGGAAAGGANLAIALKQINPVWHANEAYFEKRQMPVPAEYSEQRMLKGILGEQAIFLSEGLVLYSAQSENPEISGANLAEDFMSLVYSKIEVDSDVIITR